MIRIVGRASLLLLSLSAAFGCGNDVASDVPRSIEVSRADVQAAVDSNAQLTVALLRAFREQPGNMIYSPLSLEAVLGMLYGGARGETASQVGALLGVADDQSLLHTGLGLVLDDLGADHGYTLDLANRLFVDDQLSILASYTTLLRDAYQAPQHLLDYDNPEEARSTINAWVADQTQGNIPELLLAGDVHQRTVMNLVNAVYFKADWLHAFDAESTHDAPFHRADGSTVTTAMMRSKSVELRSATLSDAVLVELPYRSGEISFLAALPKKADGVPALEEMLATSQLSALVSQLQEGRCVIELPRFELGVRHDLIATLKTLGVVDLFNPTVADLSGINGARDLHVDLFVQEARIQVDERGTVAAAATVAGLARRAGPTPITFDHPFVFFIYDNRTGSVLFTGRVADPSEHD